MLELPSNRKIVPPNKLSELSKRLHAQNISFATLNGCFDLLHPGHLYILHEAKKQADLLVVLLNSDRSIRENKGPSRPLQKLEDRLQVIASIEWVDYVSSFDESNPCRALEILRPTVHVNGAEYGENCIEAEVVKKHGGRIHLIPRIEGLSTSQLIAKV